MQKKIKFIHKYLDSQLVLPAGIMDLSFSGLRIASENGVGLVTTKSLTLKPRKGHQAPVVAEFEGGILNSMGLCNPGIEAGIQELKEYKSINNKPVIISIYASNTEDFGKLIDYVNDSEADFVEFNLSCPNVFDEFGLPLAASTEKVTEIIKLCKRKCKIPLIAKLSPNVYDIVKIAKAAESAGADALCLINTLGPGMLIDIKMQKPILFNKFGGMSGKCVKPIALKLIYQVYSAVKIPIIGMGGITTGKDAIEMLMCGADLIGLGTAVYERGLDVFSKIKREMEEIMVENGWNDLEEIPKLEKIKNE